MLYCGQLARLYYNICILYMHMLFETYYWKTKELFPLFRLVFMADSMSVLKRRRVGGSCWFRGGRVFNLAGTYFIGKYFCKAQNVTLMRLWDEFQLLSLWVMARVPCCLPVWVVRVTNDQPILISLIWKLCNYYLEGSWHSDLSLCG